MPFIYSLSLLNCIQLFYFSPTGSSSEFSSVDLANLAEYFPYLSKDDKMPEEKLAYYRLKLDDETNRIKRSFASLVSTLQDYISEAYNIDTVVNHLLFYEPKLRELLCDCKSVIDVFSKLSMVFSFFDHNLIKILTSKFGSQNCKGRLKKYRKKFQEYTKRRICECPSDAFSGAKKPDDLSAHYVLKLEKKMENYKLEELERLRHEMNIILRKKFLRLLFVDEGCIQLTFRVVDHDPLDLAEEAQQDLRNLGIISICHGVKLYNFEKLHPKETLAKPGIVTNFGLYTHKSTWFVEDEVFLIAHYSRSYSGGGEGGGGVHT